jgi:predicted extracellular nuclease
VSSCVPTCTTEGQDRCTGQVIKTCTSVAGCLHWVTGEDCAAQSKTCQLSGDNAFCQTSGTLNLFFSEYIEGSSNNKALEIFVMSAPGGFNLSSCTVEVFSNGNTSASSTITLGSASLTAGGRFVICHSNWALAYTCDQLTGSLAFNGNDALRLSCSGVTLDVIGKIGEDPGTAWTGGGVSTFDSTLRRKCATTAGDTDGANAYDPSVYWTSSTLDDVSNLGVFLPCK